MPELGTLGVPPKAAEGQHLNCSCGVWAAAAARGRGQGLGRQGHPTTAGNVPRASQPASRVEALAAGRLSEEGTGVEAF